MPVNVVRTDRDDALWMRAKKLAIKQRKSPGYALIMHIYQNMKKASVNILTPHLTMRIPGQVPRPGMIMDFEGANPAKMPTMPDGPGPYLPLDAPVRSPQEATDGLGLRPRQRDILARAIVSAEQQAENEVVFRRKMMDTFREHSMGRSRRVAALHRALGFFRHQRPERTKLVIKSHDHHPDHPDHPAATILSGKIRSLVARAGRRGLSLRHLDDFVKEYGKDRVASAVRSLGGQVQHHHGRLFSVAQPKDAIKAVMRPSPPMQFERPASPKKPAPTQSPVKTTMQTRRALPPGTIRIWNTGDGHVRAMKMSNGTWRIVGPAEADKDKDKKKVPTLPTKLHHQGDDRTT